MSQPMRGFEQRGMSIDLTRPITTANALPTEPATAPPPQNTEETAEAAARRFAGQLIQAQDAVRNGDWVALWDALGIGERERLPQMELLDCEAIGLSTEQEIRARAVSGAIHLVAGGAIPFDGFEDLGDGADWIAGYIRDGRQAAEQ